MERINLSDIIKEFNVTSLIEIKDVYTHASLVMDEHRRSKKSKLLNILTPKHNYSDIHSLYDNKKDHQKLIEDPDMKLFYQAVADFEKENPMCSLTGNLDKILIKYKNNRFESQISKIPNVKFSKNWGFYDTKVQFSINDKIGVLYDPENKKIALELEIDKEEFKFLRNQLKIDSYSKVEFESISKSSETGILKLEHPIHDHFLNNDMQINYDFLDSYAKGFKSYQ